MHTVTDKFRVGLVPDLDGEAVINAHYVRVTSTCAEPSKTYTSRSGGEVTINTLSRCKNNKRNPPTYLSLSFK